MALFELAAQNLLTPMALFFALGLVAAFIRSDLSVPEAIAKGMALYLMLAIGFKGGVQMGDGGAGLDAGATILVAIALSFALPLIAFPLVRMLAKLPRADAAAIAGCYGSISIVTFVAATQMLGDGGANYEGYLVAAAAAMEAPAILTALWLARKSRTGAADPDQPSVLREALTNGSVVLLVGAFIIGWVTGPEGLEAVAPFVVDPFKGVLCLFLLDMGLVAGRGLRQSGDMLNARLAGFAVAMPLIGAALATPLAWLVGLSAGGAALLITLSASASYIAVPAAMRLALPEARPGLYLTLSIGVTFPFNLILGLPLYGALGRMVGG